MGQIRKVFLMLPNSYYENIKFHNLGITLLKIDYALKFLYL